ncbi:hypothetical protein AAFC00_000688 [Neodothiora populina]|uniref:Uncharacterized protein n=1 Tax=Neodothiora populina TaxID=2781224 RepID=A0ABR3PDQ3_9PEZI
MESTSSLHKEDLGLGWEQEEVLDVLDLPQLYQKPSHKQLLDTLSLLSYEPKSWDATPYLTPSASTPSSLSGANTPARPRTKVRSEGLPQYLTRIVASPLAWIADDEQKEEIWDAASVRLSERSGRTGMGAITRNFRIPWSAVPTNASSTMQPVITTSSDQDMSVEISIHEPALTEDNLGLKTWASSYVLARKWHSLKNHLPLLPQSSRPTVLELGAGTGLVGMAAATVLQAEVLLTDLPDIVPNLARNIAANADIIRHGGGSARAATLDWTVPDKIVHPLSDPEEHDSPSDALEEEAASQAFPLVLAADPIYTPEHPAWLVQTISSHLARSESARVVIILPIRDAYLAEREDLKRRMKELGLAVVREETEYGFDDWSEAGRDDELAEVECWLTVWAWDDSR